MFVPEFGRERVVGVGDLDFDLDRGGESDAGGGSCAACAMMSSWLSVRFAVTLL